MQWAPDVWRHLSPLCFSQERHPGDSKNYNECIRHETMRVAVCDMLEGKVACPEALWWDQLLLISFISSRYAFMRLSLHPLSCWCMVAMCLCVIRSVMEKSFLEYYDFYEGVCKERLYLQGQNMQVSCAYLYLYWLIDVYGVKKHKSPVHQPVRYVCLIKGDFVTSIKR